MYGRVDRDAVQSRRLELPRVDCIKRSAREILIDRLQHLQSFHQAVGVDDAIEEDRGLFIRAVLWIEGPDVLCFQRRPNGSVRVAPCDARAQRVDPGASARRRTGD
jgi:hypothetical protein